MRLFVALDLEAAITHRLQAAIEEFRRRAPSARWTRVESIHITLKFIGEVPAEKEESIKRALNDINAPALAITIRGTGFFPNPRQPRVFWAGIAAGPELADLAAAISAALEPLGIEREARAFSPHLTLARANTPGDMKGLVSGSKTDQPVWGSQVSSAFYLYQSHPGRGGYHYEKRRAFPLGE